MSRLFSKGNQKKKKDKLLVNIDTKEDPEATWDEVDNLGEGSFGMVTKVKHLKNGSFAAAKVIPVKYEEELEDFVVEVDILTECKHPGIVGLVAAHLWKDNLWVLLELCGGGAMDDILIELETGFDENVIAAMTYQMTDAIVFLHEKFVIHRDLKAGNVLLKQDGTVKLTDFGVSAKNKKKDQKRNTFIGTPYWMAPEVVLCENSSDKPYSYPSDIWSFGITLIEFAEMAPPWHDMHPMRVLFKIPKSPSPTLTDPSKWSNEFHSFLSVCLKKEEGARSTAAALRSHAFIKGKSSRTPVKNLYKLANAEVIETLEDLDDDANASAMPETPQPASKLPALQGASAASKLPEAPAGGFTNPKSATAILAAELEAAKIQSPSLLKADDFSKNYKTLTRMRQYVDESGEIVTVTTQRVVETAVQSGKAMTIRRGMVNIDKDWKDAEATKLAKVRNEQLRETKIVQREEQKECADFIRKLKVERDQMEARQASAVTSMQSQSAKALLAQQKAGKIEQEKLVKQLDSQLASKTKAIKAAAVKEFKDIKASNAQQLKQTLKELDSLPKADRKDAKKRAKDEGVSRNAEMEQALQGSLDQDADKAIAEEKSNNETALRDKELALLKAEQDTKMSQAKAQSALGQEHVQESQQMLKHQLKATFWMQKYQMHFRHEKELDQLKRLQEKKLADLQKKFDTDTRLLPKKQRTAMTIKRKELKKSIASSDKPTQKAKMKEFEADEGRRTKAEHTQMEENFRASLDNLKASVLEETDELKKMQEVKKKTLVENETEKLKELESRHAIEINQYLGEVRKKEEALQAQFDQQTSFLK